MEEKRTRYKVVTMETSLFRGTISGKRLQGLINDTTMAKDGWRLAWLFVDKKRKWLLFRKKTVFLVFERDSV